MVTHERTEYDSLFISIEANLMSRDLSEIVLPLAF